ncbi:MAG: hypothetical protein EHM68_00020 [Lysobacterales bacterium]|nr:MAG: hypothetical protein EHM68_00020 [Xanthomonadales bacterium]
MKRRTVLAVGVGTGALLALAGGTLALLKPGLQGGRLSPAGRDLFAAVARAVLADLLPADAAAREQATQAHLQRLDATIAGVPPAVQAEIDELVSLLASAPGRLGLAGLGIDWAQASTDDVQATLQRLRTSSLALRQQIYHALRNLTNAAWFADAAAWPAIGYPGPRAV